jgi:hypothetical protein
MIMRNEGLDWCCLGVIGNCIGAGTPSLIYRLWRAFVVAGASLRSLSAPDGFEGNDETLVVLGESLSVKTKRFDIDGFSESCMLLKFFDFLSYSNFLIGIPRLVASILLTNFKSTEGK